MIAGRDARFAATWALVGLILRRDRIRLTVWITSLAALMVVSSNSVWGLYDTAESVASYVGSVGDNPALVMFAGPGYGFDAPNVGVILVNETSLWMGLAMSLMSIFLVVRHTRAEEDIERADLVRSLAVGRDAPAIASLVVILAANVAVGVASWVALAVIGFDAIGSLALCLSFTLVGIAFGAVALIAAQVAPTARSALGLGSGLLGGAFVARGIGDVSASLLSWSTPFGWGIGTRAFANERWWPLAGLAVVAVAMAYGGFWLSAHRDLGSGVVAQRAGPPEATPWLRTPTGLAWRLQRVSIAGWLVGICLTGLVYGSLGEEIETMLRDNPQLADYLARLDGASITEAYLATAVSMLGMVAGGFAMASVLRSRSEESAGYAELLLTASVSRAAWVRSHLALSFGGTLAITAVAGFGTGVSYALTSGDPSQVGRLTLAGLATTPAGLVLAGIAMLLVGWAPRWSTSVWAVFGAVVAIGIFGEVLGLSTAIRSVSPYEHLASLPAEPWDAGSAIALTGIALALVLAGSSGFRRRDLRPD